MACFWGGLAVGLRRPHDFNSRSQDSEQLSAFRAACSRQSDRNFAYRFVYQLRGITPCT